jgi:hypothetical protein
MRAEQMERYWKRGWTLERIGKKYGITRQRVQQILKKRGCSRGNGGDSMRADERERARKKKQKAVRRSRDRACRARWGIGLDEYEKLRAMDEDIQKTPMYRFRNSRRMKLRKGIGWELTFAQWWDYWQRSGKWDQYGNRSGKYALVRKDNKNVYKRGNVAVMEMGEFHRIMNQK